MNGSSTIPTNCWSCSKLSSHSCCARRYSSSSYEDVVERESSLRDEMDRGIGSRRENEFGVGERSAGRCVRIS
jgi:hypothetical protein